MQNEQNNNLEIEAFLIKYPQFFVDQVSRHFPFSEDQLEKFDDKLRWPLVSGNQNIRWTNKIIEKYKQKLQWHILSRNPTIIWTNKRWESYSDFIDWSYMSTQENLKWSDRLVEKFEGLWDWDKLSMDGALPWSVRLIEAHKDKWKWHRLAWNGSLPWSESLLKKYREEWEKEDHDWTWGDNPGDGYITRSEKIMDYICDNVAIPWTKKLRVEFGCKPAFPEKKKRFSRPVNREFTGEFTAEEVEAGKDELNWGGLGSIGLSRNVNLPWSLEFIRKYKDKINFKNLSFNKGDFWTWEILLEHQDKWSEVNLAGNEAIWESVLKDYVTSDILDLIFK